MSRRLLLRPSSSASARRALLPLPRRRIDTFSTRAALSREVRDAYIVGAARTPTGAFNGALSSVPAPQLCATAIRAALSRAALPPSSISHAFLGSVLQAGLGQSPARQAALAAGLPPSCDATTVNKVCASGLKAVALAADEVALGRAEAVVAGGMESMSRVPYYLPRGAGMPAFGDIKVSDGLILDGLTDAYEPIHMGVCAERTAAKYGITRESQDAYALQSYARASRAWEDGLFAEEIAPVTVKGRKGEAVVAEDEGYARVKPEKVPTLKPAFVRDGSGTVTAANASPLSDGASALVLASAAAASQAAPGSRVLARVLASADAAVAPADFPVAPAEVVPPLLAVAGISAADVAVWEFNEAFACVIRANAKILGLEGAEYEARVNPRGGAIALGHALGSSGSRILVTLLHQLKVGEYGVAAICNGGGAATGLLVQRVAEVQ